jgi:hypothetical protein
MTQWSSETHSFNNISASPATFQLYGGAYGVTVHAASWSSGSVTLQRLAADGATYVTVMTAFTQDGYASGNYPAGTYKLTIASATGVSADVTSVIANK